MYANTPLLNTSSRRRPRPTPIPICPNCPAPTYIKLFSNSPNLLKNFTMAKSWATIIALFCLFTLSLAAHALPDEDEVSTQVSLPNPNEPVNSKKQFNSFVVSSVPLTKIPFRTVNRRFPVQSKHPCHHHHKVHPTMKGNEEIPYGNDMIFSSGENSDFEEPVVYAGGRRIPGRWLRLHHHHHHDGEDSNSDDGEDEDRMKKIAFKRYDYDRFDREEELNKLRKQFRLQNGEEVKKMMKKGGFMRRVRKFLDHYF